MTQKVNPKWSAFWLALGLVAASGEGVAIASNGAQDSLSAQVWFVLGLNPDIYAAGIAVFSGAVGWLAYHFFAHRSQ